MSVLLFAPRKRKQKRRSNCTSKAPHLLAGLQTHQRTRPRPRLRRDALSQNPGISHPPSCRDKTLRDPTGTGSSLGKTPRGGNRRLRTANAVRAPCPAHKHRRDQTCDPFLHRRAPAKHLEPRGARRWRRPKPSTRLALGTTDGARSTRGARASRADTSCPTYTSSCLSPTNITFLRRALLFIIQAVHPTCAGHTCQGQRRVFTP